MKKLLILFAFSFCLSGAFAQGTWTSRDTLPDSAMIQGISGFSINGYGYAGLGENVAGNYENYFWLFDASTDTWTKKANFPGNIRVAPASFVIGDKAYLVTGSVKNFGTCVTECWEYDATNNTWTQKANFPGAARTYAVGFAIDSLGYVGTGANELADFRKDFYAYHPSTNTWTRIADFGGIARSGASGFAVNGKGYVYGGQDSTIKYYGDMWEYDPIANSWTRKATIPSDDSTSPHLDASGFAICNNIYLGSGVDTAYKFSREFWKYNTVSNTWTEEASVPGITKVEGAAFAIGDTGYYGFGEDSTGSKIINVFDKFYAGDTCNVDAGYSIIKDASEINIYPNPVYQNLYVRFDEQYSEPATILIMDITGRIIKSYSVSSYSAPMQIDISYLTSGMYLITMKTKDNSITQKFIKQ